MKRILLVVSQACVYFLLEQSHLWGATKEKNRMLPVTIIYSTYEKGES